MEIDRLRQACRQGNIELVKSLTTAINDSEKYDWRRGCIVDACEGGHIDIVQHLIIDKWTLNHAFSCLCRFGHLELVHFLISKEANDWNYSLCQACYGGHIEIARFLVGRGADDYSGGLDCACINGHEELVRFMVDLEQRQQPYLDLVDDLNRGLKKACCSGHIEIVRFLISGGANNWSLGFLYAYRNGHMDIAALILEHVSEIDIDLVPWDKYKIIQLLYLKTPLYKFRCGRSKVQELKNEIDLVKTSIKNQDVLLPDLLTIISRYIIV